ncbi:MAG: ABC transporter substrate-binding protein [Sciscionella sp.]
MISRISQSLRRMAPWVRWAVLGLVVVLVAGVAVVFYRWVAYCGDGVEQVDGQCVGVTDGNVGLSPDIADVLGRIRAENARVSASPQASVSVGYLLPLPKPGSNQNLATSLRHELEGAYTAQLRANHTIRLGGPPKLRLLVANDGDGSAHWEQVVDVLLDAVNDQHSPLVSVVATGQSRATTGSAISKLISNHVPVIASRITADSVTPPTEPSPVDGLLRLAPRNTDQAVAAARYVKSRGKKRALIVQNDDQNDTYSHSLGAGFRRAFSDSGHTVLPRTETYNPKYGAVASTMHDIATNTICAARPDVVFFAGRSPELAAFVAALPQRTCGQLPVDIVTGSDAVDFGTAVASGNRDLRNALRADSRITVSYTALAHPRAWTVEPDSVNQNATMDLRRNDCEVCFPHLFPGQSLDDGAAIMGNDAIVTAAHAIRFGGPGTVNDRPLLLFQEFDRMHGARAVPGASGWLSFDNNGTAIDKAVPILRVKSDGGVQFVQLSAPDDAPCRPDTPPCTDR